MARYLPRTPDEARWYLAGVVDGEGHVAYPKASFGYQGRYIEIVNTDPAIIEACEVACSILGYNFSTRGPLLNSNKKPIWSLVISRRATLMKAGEELPLQSAKFKQMIDLLASYKQERKIHEVA